MPRLQLKDPLSLPFSPPLHLPLTLSLFFFSLHYCLYLFTYSSVWVSLYLPPQKNEKKETNFPHPSSSSSLCCSWLCNPERSGAIEANGKTKSATPLVRRCVWFSPISELHKMDQLFCTNTGQNERHLALHHSSLWSHLLHCESSCLSLSIP